MKLWVCKQIVVGSKENWRESTLPLNIPEGLVESGIQAWGRIGIFFFFSVGIVHGALVASLAKACMVCALSFSLLLLFSIFQAPLTPKCPSSENSTGNWTPFQVFFIFFNNYIFCNFFLYIYWKCDWKIFFEVEKWMEIY